MVGYLYHITSKTTGKKYIGITSDIVRRFRRHKTELNNNTHHSPKLQNAWNYYGADDFVFSYVEIEIN
jgi:group I intron endonuclease